MAGDKILRATAWLSLNGVKIGDVALVSGVTKSVPSQQSSGRIPVTSGTITAIVGLAMQQGHTRDGAIGIADRYAELAAEAYDERHPNVLR
jgi:hypothetical protein